MAFRRNTASPDHPTWRAEREPNVPSSLAETQEDVDMMYLRMLLILQRPADLVMR